MLLAACCLPGMAVRLCEHDRGNANGPRRGRLVTTRHERRRARAIPVWVRSHCHARRSTCSLSRCRPVKWLAASFAIGTADKPGICPPYATGPAGNDRQMCARDSNADRATTDPGDELWSITGRIRITFVAPALRQTSSQPSSASPVAYASHSLRRFRSACCFAP